MKHKIQQLLNQSLDALVTAKVIDSTVLPKAIPVERPRRAGQGDYASGIALAIARAAGRKPRDLATLIKDNLPSSTLVNSIEIAGPGFINFFISEQALMDVITDVLEQRENYGTGVVEKADSILIEFVSANPTGPLHVGHGRGAAYGDTLARLLRAAGHQVSTEYYVNDIGRQMDILTVSVWIRYQQQLEGDAISLPKAAYQGDYIVDIAKHLRQRHDARFDSQQAAEIEAKGTSDDEVLDSIIGQVRELLGADRFTVLRKFVLSEMVDVIRADLGTIGVVHDEWFFESQVTKSGELEAAIAALEQNGCVYESEGAAWFRSSDYGDEKDRVLRRSNGELTYFSTDIAYHLNKLRRGHDLVINVWGADHHGYVARMKAAVQAAGEDAERLYIHIVQFAALWRGKQKIPMSTRAGEFVSLQESG